MDTLKGIGFDALGIEDSFADFFGEAFGARNEIYNAGRFNIGEVSNFGNLLEIVADRFEQRVQKIQFNAAEPQGGSRHKIENAISNLRTLSKKMKKCRNEERDDYHWMIIGSLIWSIQGLLEHIGV